MGLQTLCREALLRISKQALQAYVMGLEAELEAEQRAVHHTLLMSASEPQLPAQAPSLSLGTALTLSGLDGEPCGVKGQDHRDHRGAERAEHPKPNRKPPQSKKQTVPALRLKAVNTVNVRERRDDPAASVDSGRPMRYADQPSTCGAQALTRIPSKCSEVIKQATPSLIKVHTPLLTHSRSRFADCG